MGTNKSEIGKFLRKLRFDNNDESQEVMAKRLGVATPYISLLEGKQALTKKLAIKIMKEYNLTGEAKAKFVDIVTRDIVRRYWGNKA